MSLCIARLSYQACLHCNTVDSSCKNKCKLVAVLKTTALEAAYTMYNWTDADNINTY